MTRWSWKFESLGYKHGPARDDVAEFRGMPKRRRRKGRVGQGQGIGQGVRRRGLCDHISVSGLGTVSMHTVSFERRQV